MLHFNGSSRKRFPRMSLPKKRAFPTAPCVRFGYASASALGWSIGGQNPNLRTGVIHGGRSNRDIYGRFVTLTEKAN